MGLSLRYLYRLYTDGRWRGGKVYNQPRDNCMGWFSHLPAQKELEIKV